MNFYTPFPMHGYHTKLAGMYIAILGLLLFTWVLIAGQPLSWMEFNFEEQIRFSVWIFALGLTLMAFSKEKVDDERVQRIRQVALRSGFSFLVGTFMSLNIVDLLTDFEVQESLALVTFSLIFYHFIFYIALFRNPDWAYRDVTVAENFKMNKKFYVIHILVLILIVMVMAIISWLKN